MSTRRRKAAAAADRRLAKGKALSSPIDGVPMTIKESFDWAGAPSTWGDPGLKDNIAAKNAVALQHMTSCWCGALWQNQCAHSPGGLAELQ